MDTDQGSELDSEDEINKGGQWNDFDCDTDESFTLNLKVYENEVYKDDSSTTDLVIASNNHAPEICDGGRKKRSTGISFCDEIPVTFKEMEDEIERQLDAKAAKSNLSVINVKNILKSVITNEDVMAMVRHSMLNEDDGSWLTYEPKLTRSKAKELLKSQPEITLPLLTPTKKQSECQILIEKELSEDSSDDDEYKPVEDETEQSEDEKSSVADSLSSPVRKVMTPTLPLTSEFGSVDMRDEDTVTNVECGTQTCWTDDGLFKIPQARQEGTEKPEENIGQRTRSKLCLNNTPLEVIESAFVPPDITTDMYDSECDDEDWTAFLKDFATNNGDNENVEDDDAGDPEYNVLADLDQTVDKEELRVDKAVKISRKEKKVLMAEAYEPLFSDDDDFDLLQFFPSVDNTDTQASPNLPQESSNMDQHWATSHPDKSTSGRDTLMVVGNEEPRNEAVGKATCSEPSSLPPSSNEDPIPDISETQRAIIRQQMRQHVQLLSQNFLQLYCHPYLSKYANSFKSLLVNLRCLSLYKEGSHFEAENLKCAIDLVIEWEKLLDTNPDTKIEMQNFIKKEIEKGDYLKKMHVRHRERLPPSLMDFMANSKVFVYPLLLPMVAFRRDNRGEHSSYLPSEEQLIAIGMEQFVPYVESMKDIRKREVLDRVVCLLHQLLLPLRTCVYTKNYILNVKSHDRKGGAITYYLRNNKAPETHHYVFPVDWEKSVCPKQVPKRNLPENWARHIYGFTKEEEGFLRFKRKKVKRKWWGKQFAIPVLLIGDFPDFQTAKEFGQGTLDYTKLSGKVFRMLPSMPLISNITKDIVEHTSNDEDLPKVVFSVGTVHRGTQTKHPSSPMSLPVLTSPVIGSSKKTSPLKTVTPILKKYNSHRKGKGGNLMKNISPSGEKGSESSPGKSSPRNIAPKPMVVFVPSEKLNLPELVTTDAIDASNVSSQEAANVGVNQTISDSSVVDGVEISPIIPDISPSSCESVSQTRILVNEAQQNHSKQEGSTKETEKKDNEDELAALMIASSTIRGPTANLERKRKSKQQRDTDAKLALLSPEKGSATEERDYIFAHAFFKKLEERLKNGTEEGCSSFENLVHILNELAEEKPSHEVENLLKQILQILGPHKDLVEEFSCFLNSKQALHQGCLASHLSGIQMRDFIHKLEVYFAKQPNHVHKIIQAISDLSTRPCITLEEIKEEIVPLLKGNLILLHKLLQLLPTERPLVSLMTDFEELEFVEDLDLNIDMEPVENVRLPEKDLEDRFGGEGCECPCHSSTPSSVPSGEKESTRTSHCNRCGLKFVNGRVVLQTAKGIRPAKVTFDSPADFQRVVVKDVVQPPRLNKGRSRKKNKLSESKDESLSPPPKIRIIHCAESEDDALATRVSDLTSSPRTTQSRAGGKGARSASSKGKDAKSTSTQQKNSLSEASQLPGDSEIPLKSNVNGTSDSKDLPSVSASNKSSSEGEPKVVMDSSLQSLGKVIDGGDSSSQDLESQTISEECSSTISESSTKVDSSNPADESAGVNADGIPWTREEDRIILQTFKADGGKSDALVKIRQKLPERSVDEIVSRFQELMSLFRKMTVPTTTGEEEDIVMEKRMSDEN